MLRLLSALLGILFLLSLAAAGALLIASEPRPLVAAGPQPNAAEMRWLRTLAESPLGQGGDGAAGMVRLSPRQSDLLLDLAARRAADGHARATLGGGEALVEASIPLRWRRGGYANLRLRLAQTEHLPEVISARVGALPLPAFLVQYAMQRWIGSLAWVYLPERVELTPTEVRLAFTGSAADAHPAASMAPAGGSEARRNQRLGAQQASLRQQIAAHTGPSLDLAVLLSELLTADAARWDEPDPGADSVADNRALLQVLAAYVNGRPLPLEDGAPRPPARTVTLRGRRDLAQHFTASAAMAVQGGAELSHLVGLGKELRDADGGSGFSFADLTANRAGIRFAELATGSAAGARYVQRLARAGALDAAAIMPAIDGLPEGMRGDALERRIGAVGSPAYAQLVDHIDRRIDALALYRGAHAMDSSR